MNTSNPFLQGNFSPWPTEGFVSDIKNIKGEIPKELSGALIRNGPNPQFPVEDAHWFEGDGMLHAFYIHNGKVSYRNQWVRTERFKLEREAGRRLFGTMMNPSTRDPSVVDISGNPANTNIIQHAGKLLALVETACPVEIDLKNLQTIGSWDFNGGISTMSAHPHFDPSTGEMHNYACTFGSPVITYYSFDKLGKVIKSENITAPFPSFMHDFFITRDYVIFPVLPLTTSKERAMQGQSAIMWQPEKGSHIGIMPRNGSAKDLVWFEMEPFYAFHYMNAYQDGDDIILDGMKMRNAHLFPDNTGKQAKSSENPPQLTCWRFGLNTNRCLETLLDETTAEFPRFDERFTGIRNNHGFACASISSCSQELGTADSIIHYNIARNSNSIRQFGIHSMPSEPVFVLRKHDVEEGDGFILTVVYNADIDCSELYILDAMNIDKEPIAVIQCPHRVPNGFHGNWVADNKSSYYNYITKPTTTHRD